MATGRSLLVALVPTREIGVSESQSRSANNGDLLLDLRDRTFLVAIEDGLEDKCRNVDGCLLGMVSLA